MNAWARNVWLAVYELWAQLLLWVDQGGNVIICGLNAVVAAIVTGARQNVAYADETLSAHAWRSSDRRRIWGRIWRPVIDFLWSWQGEDEQVNQRAGRPISGHCERAFWKELIRRGLPPAYRDDAVATNLTEGARDG